MQVSFVKTSHAEYTLRCVRADGSVAERPLNARSFVAHDLVHFAYETEAGRQRSFFGAIAQGHEPGALVTDELAVTEMIVGPLQGALKAGLAGQDLLPRLVEYAHAQGVTLPAELSVGQIDRVLAWVREALVRYDALRTGEALAFVFTPRSSAPPGRPA